jgi:hypothetical protein
MTAQHTNFLKPFFPHSGFRSQLQIPILCKRYENCKLQHDDENTVLHGLVLVVRCEIRDDTNVDCVLSFSEFGRAEPFLSHLRFFCSPLRLTPFSIRRIYHDWNILHRQGVVLQSLGCHDWLP